MYKTKIKYKLFNIGILISIMLLSIIIICESFIILLSDDSKKTMAVLSNDWINDSVCKLIDEMFPNIGFLEKKEACNMDDYSYVVDEILPSVSYSNTYQYRREDYIKTVSDIPSYFYADEDTTDPAVISQLEQAAPVSENLVGVEYSLEQLSNYDFLKSTFYIVDSTTSITDSELNASNFLSKDMTINLEGDEPKILIYHTHGSEAFCDSEEGVTEDTVIGVGDELARILTEQYGIAVYHDRTVYDVIDGKLDRNMAYDNSLQGITKILDENPSIEVVIDLHRDGVNENTHLVTSIDGKQTAKIMFFNGLSRTAKNGDIEYLYNPNKEYNLAFSFQMQLKAIKLYPGFTRKIYLKSYLYNLHVKPRTTLVEVGGQTNTVEEAKNAMSPLARLLYLTLSGKEE